MVVIKNVENVDDYLELVKMPESRKIQFYVKIVLLLTNLNIKEKTLKT